MGPLVIEGLGVAYGSLVVDDKRLIGGQYLVLAHVPELGRAVAVRGLDPHDLLVQPALVHRANVRWLQELGRVLVHVHHRYVDRCAEREKIKINKCTTDYLVLKVFLG